MAIYPRPSPNGANYYKEHPTRPPWQPQSFSSDLDSHPPAPWALISGLFTYKRWSPLPISVMIKQIEVRALNTSADMHSNNTSQSLSYHKINAKETLSSPLAFFTAILFFCIRLCLLFITFRFVLAIVCCCFCAVCLGLALSCCYCIFLLIFYAQFSQFLCDVLRITSAIFFISLFCTAIIFLTFKWKRIIMKIWRNNPFLRNTHTHTYISIYIYLDTSWLFYPGSSPFFPSAWAITVFGRPWFDF